MEFLQLAALRVRRYVLDLPQQILTKDRFQRSQQCEKQASESQRGEVYLTEVGGQAFALNDKNREFGNNPDDYEHSSINDRRLQKLGCVLPVKMADFVVVDHSPDTEPLEVYGHVEEDEAEEE